MHGDLPAGEKLAAKVKMKCFLGCDKLRGVLHIPFNMSSAKQLSVETRLSKQSPLEAEIRSGNKEK